MTNSEKLARAKAVGKLNSETVRAEITALKAGPAPTSTPALLKRVEAIEKLLGV